MYSYVVLGMLYGHILDDYVLQQVLAKLKQKKFWEENAPDDLYKNDYIAALICHALEWSISVHIAPFLFIIYTGLINNPVVTVAMTLSVIINTIIHTVIDDYKANKHKLSLIQDQLLHLIQIVATSCILYIIMFMQLH